MDEEILEQEQDSKPDPFAQLVELQRQNNELLQRLSQRPEPEPEPEPQYQQPEAPEWETPEERRIRLLEERLAQRDQLDQQSALDRAADKKDRVIDYLRSHADLTEDERAQAVEMARKYDRKEFVNVTDVAKVVDFIAGQATLSARRAKPKEAAGSNSPAKAGKNQIDSGYASWLRKEARSDVSDADLVKMGYHEDEDMIEAYNKSRGRRG
jgi:hypothetical protein